MNRLLIVDNSSDSTAFLENYSQKIYKKWKVVVIGKPFKSSLDKVTFSGLTLNELLNTCKDRYKQFMIIDSNSYLIRDFNLDLVPEILEFPTVDDFGAITAKNTNDTLANLKQSLKYKLIKFSIVSEDNWQIRSHSYQYVNFLFINKAEHDYVVDYVFPYVDADDPEWFANYTKYKSLESTEVEAANAKDGRYETNYSTGLQRFRSNDLMKYVFRSIEQNLPFIRKVHILVASESQVPDWINRDEVDVIVHSEFIPQKFLPTFSSSEIEMFLPNLPRVSEYFIYGNDDEYIMKAQELQHWFFEGKPVTHANIRSAVDSFTGDEFRKNDLLLTAPRDLKLPANSCLGQQHCPQPYVLSKMRECYAKYEEQILASCTRFRENTKNFNQWIFLGYNYFNDYMYQKKRLCLTTDLGKYNESVDLKKYTCICMNDSEESTYQDNLNLFRQKMDEFFPRKSKYEL